MNGFRLLRRWMAGRGRASAGPLPGGAIFSRQRDAFRAARIVVGIFYVCNVSFCVFAWKKVLDRVHAGIEAPLWPIAWVRWIDPAVAIELILSAYLITALAAMFWPHRRLARIAGLMGLLEMVAFLNSLGKINHSYHAFLWSAFLLIFLPDGSDEQFDRSRCRRQRYLNILWSVQFFVLLFYTMAGASKLVSVPRQILAGESSSLSPDALPRHIAHRLLLTDSASYLGPFFIQHTYLSWLLYLGVLYLELFSVFAAFRPVLHRAWGLGLVAMHLGIGITMNIWFFPPVLLDGLLLVNSPFAAPQTTIRGFLAALPVIGFSLRRRVARPDA